MIFALQREPGVLRAAKELLKETKDGGYRSFVPLAELTGSPCSYISHHALFEASREVQSRADIPWEYTSRRDVTILTQLPRSHTSEITVD